jgi:RNA-directed DNA polymerase
VNTDASAPTLEAARAWVLRMQTKLHQWATDAPKRRFDDLYNLVHHPCTLEVAWERVRANRGARSAGVDGVRPRAIGADAARWLAELRADLKTQQFRPDPVRERRIPKPGTNKVRRLGIPTARDRVVQAALKLVLEPIFEADFQPCSYGFRPKRRAQDAIAEIHFLTSRSYEWVCEADIEACFDEISHPALLQRVRARIGDKRVLALLKAFLKADVLSEEGVNRESITGTPQGGILSPLLANIALGVLDEHFTARWQALGPDWRRAAIRKRGGATIRLIRYSDDFVILVAGTREHAVAAQSEAAAALAPMGLRLSAAKTRVRHIDEGFDFLGFHIQRRTKRGTSRQAIYTYPSAKALLAIKRRVRSLTRREQHRTLADLLRRLNPALRGWCTYFQHGVSKRTFSYVDDFAFWQVIGWLRKRHAGLPWKTLRRRYLPGWQPTERGETMFRPTAVTVSRYRYRGPNIPNPWTSVHAAGAT